MKSLIFFVIAFLITLTSFKVVNPSKPSQVTTPTHNEYSVSLNPSDFDTIAKTDHTTVVYSKSLSDMNTIQSVPDLTQFIEYILATFGSIISTLILALLKRKFPDWFATAKEQATIRNKDKVYRN